MKSATSIPPALAERAMQLADELELTGELPKDFVAGLEEPMARQQRALATRAELAAPGEWQL